MGKKVKVTTKCGETFYYDHDQEVDSVEIIKEDPTYIGSISLGSIARAFGNMDSDYFVMITHDSESGDIIIAPCGVGTHIWSYLVNQDKLDNS